MRTKLLIACIVLSLAEKTFGQLKNTLILKTRPLNTLFLQNMNLAFEYPFNSMLSLEIQGLWKRKKWFNDGSFESRGGFYRSNGYELGIAPKFYFKRNAPEGLYTSLNFTYNYYVFNDFKQNLGEQTNEFRIVDITEKGPELVLNLGWQKVFANHFTTEIYGGFGRYNRTYKEVLISGDSFGFINGLNKKFNHWNTAHVNFTFG